MNTNQRFIPDKFWLLPINPQLTYIKQTKKSVVCQGTYWLDNMILNIFDKYFYLKKCILNVISENKKYNPLSFVWIALFQSSVFMHFWSIPIFLISHI